MNCSSCAGRVSQAASSVPAVRHVEVLLEAGQVWVAWNPQARQDLSGVLEAIRKAGYTAEAVSEEPCGHEASSSRKTGWWFNVMFGGALTLPLMAGEWVMGWGMEAGFQWFAFASSLPVLVVCGARFFQGAWSQLKQGQSNMDTLVTLGSTTAFAYSTWALLTATGQHVYFMESAAIITLISTGHWLEALVGERATQALRSLMQLAPPVARRLTSSGAEEEVPVKELRLGDRVMLRPGDRVPTDGLVLDGQSAVDESMLTGESLPVEKSAGGTVYAGTFNAGGVLTVRVDALGGATALAQIIQVVRRAQSSRASIQRLADRVSSVFVPCVILVAMATAAAWGLAPDRMSNVHVWLSTWLWVTALPSTALAAAAVHAAAVLIVACPCAMGLATPAAIMAASNAAARRGILIRDGQALEKTGRITAVVFDKTGTLTEGHLSVVDRLACGAEEPDDRTWAWLGTGLAGQSHHPVSRAIHAYCATLSQGPSGIVAHTERPGAWQEHRGAGIEATFSHEAPFAAGSTVRLGQPDWLELCGVDVSIGDSYRREQMKQGATVTGLAVGARLLCLFSLQDRLRAEAPDVVRQLLAQGLEVFLVTGDHRDTASAIARRAGIPDDCVTAGVAPAQKAQSIAEWQARGHRVAFVGDGINDAPPLEQADLGIAVSRATDVAREAADILLLKPHLNGVLEAMSLARATLRTIKQNLFWAFFYNAAAVPLAALGFLSPILCAAAMGLSDLLVMANALRLLRHKP